MDPIRQSQQHVRPLWQARPDRTLLPLDGVELSESARRNAEQIGDLSRLRTRETEMQRLLAEQRERRESWREIYQRELEHQQRLLELLREAQDAWLESFRAATRANQESLDRINRMWSDYFRA